jgi:hypothetical protein
VVRAPLSDALDPYAYQAYYRDPSGNEYWNPSLPAGFTKETMLDYLGVKGPMTTDLMGDEGHHLFGNLRFSVARVRDKDYFIGVESYIDYADDRKYKTALRFSADLLHWTDRQTIIDVATDFTTSRMNYPIFLSADGWSNSVVDENDFYILGTASTISNVVYKKHISLSGQTFGVQALTMPGGAMPAGGNNSLQVLRVSPNPGPGLFQLGYTLGDYAIVRVNVLDMTGRRLQRGIPVQRAPGSYTEQVDIGSFAGGVYLLELMTGKERRIVKVVRE